MPIIFEDNHIVVVIKPHGVCVDDMLLELQTKYGYAATVHRLDQVTGGVMVFARSSKAASRLSEQIARHAFEKTYLAVVVAMPKNREATLVNYLLKNEVKNEVSVVPAATTGAKRAELFYRVRKTPVTAEGVLVEVNLVTGRTHQIRVQMSHIGCAIWGDAKYGKKTDGELALWAHEISFTHPTTDEVMRFIVNPPETVPWTSFDFDRQSHKTRGV